MPDLQMPTPPPTVLSERRIVVLNPDSGVQTIFAVVDGDDICAEMWAGFRKVKESPRAVYYEQAPDLQQEDVNHAIIVPGTTAVGRPGDSAPAPDEDSE